MRKYLMLFQNYYATNLEYRTNLITLILWELIGIGTVAILWLSIYRTNSEIGGLNFSHTISYYLLVPLLGFITHVHDSNRLGREIRKGQLSSQLIKPYKIWFASLMYTIAEKINFLTFIFPLYILILIWLNNYFEVGLFTVNSIFTALIIAILGFILHYVIDLSLTWLTFWVDEIWAFRHFKNVVLGILGGVSFPFDFVPQQFRNIIELFPFKFLYYIPISYLLQNRSPSHLLPDLLEIIIWTTAISLIAWKLWQKGIKKYGAYGN